MTIVKIFNFGIYICSNGVGVAEKISLEVQVMSHPRKLFVTLVSQLGLIKKSIAQHHRQVILQICI